MKKKKFLAAIAVLFSASVIFSEANAALVNEIGDAGDLPGTAQVLGAGTTQVNGSVSNGADADMFAFGWGGGALDLTATQNASGIDTQVFLFDSTGLGLYHNDDAPFPDSIISLANLVAGVYYAAVTNWSNDPLSVGGAIFPIDFSGLLGPTGPGGGSPITGWEGDGGSSVGAYSLTFSSATAAVPEPATVVLIGLGLAGVGFSRKRKQSAD